MSPTTCKINFNICVYTSCIESQISSSLISEMRQDSENGETRVQENRGDLLAYASGGGIFSLWVFCLIPVSKLEDRWNNRDNSLTAINLQDSFSKTANYSLI